MGVERRYYYQRSRGRSNRFKNLLKRGLYRSRRGVIFGVCRGIAEYFNFSIFWARIITVALFLITGFWPTGVLYILAALLMKPEPVILSGNRCEQEFYDDYMSSKDMVNRIKRRYSNLERRIRRVEHSVTSPEYDWENRLNS
jgi:phage shock protein C